MVNIQGRNMQLYVLICVVIYSCVPTIYLIHFPDYIIDQYNGDDSSQSQNPHWKARVNTRAIDVFNP